MSAFQVAFEVLRRVVGDVAADVMLTDVIIEAANEAAEPENPCPYTHSHTRHWCGYKECRDS